MKYTCVVRRYKLIINIYGENISAEYYFDSLREKNIADTDKYLSHYKVFCFEDLKHQGRLELFVRFIFPPISTDYLF